MITETDTHFCLGQRVEEHLGLRCLYTNTDTLNNKLTELENFCSLNKIDLVSITETLPKNNTDCVDLKFVLEGYSALQNNLGRGVCLFYKNNLTVNEITDSGLLPHCSIFCRIKTSTDDKFTLGLVYRSPNASLEENDIIIQNLNIITCKLDPTKDKLLLLGDYNLPNINWTDESCSNDFNHINYKFLKFVHENYLIQFVNKPTHHRAEQTPTLIDLILSNDKDLVTDIKHSAPFGLSHHDVITFTLACNHEIVDLPPITKHMLDKGDYVNLRKYLDSVEWDPLLSSSDDIDIIWDKVENEINTAKNKFIPTKTFKRKTADYRQKFPTPYTLIELFHNKRKAFKYWKQYPTELNKHVYTLLRNKVNKEVRIAKRNKELDIANKSKSNPKALYQYLSSKTKPKEPVARLLDKDGKFTENDQEKASVLNDFFSSVFISEDDSSSPSFKANFSKPLNNLQISTKDMHDKLKSLNINKSPGPDEIHPKILYEAAEQLAYPFTFVFNKSIEVGRIPIKWKTAEVKPIFKKGVKSNPGNYRPVSLTSIVCKIFEFFVRDSLYDHFVNNNLLSPHQFGFCKGRSCVTQLLNTIDYWFYYIDRNIPVDAIYLDFRKAFDTVPHKRLVKKLSGYGVGGNILTWITDFLSERTQYVTVNGKSSQSVPVSSGVPQGSVLGPTLFVYYINDLPDVCEALLNMFADDAKLFKELMSIKDHHVIQHTLYALCTWSSDWLLGFNIDKCKVLHLGTNNPQYQYHMIHDNTLKILDKTECEKDLGIHVDSQLKFDNHIQTQVKKARSTAGMINCNISYKVPKVMVPLFKSNVRSLVEYGNSVWAPYLKKHIISIENIQRQFTKKIKGMKHKTYRERLVSLKLPSLLYRRFRGDLIEVFKIVHDIYDPITTKLLLTKVSDQSITRKKHNYKLTKKRANKNGYKFFFTNRIIDIWNNLPSHIADAKNVNSFKNKIDVHFRDIMFDYIGY